MTDETKYGRTAYIHYKGGVKGEEPIDDHSEGDPMVFLLGSLQLPKGIEDAITEMEIGEQRTVEIPVELAYGEYQEKLASWYPKAMLNDGYNLKVGDVMFRTNPDDGTRMPAFVTEETEDNIKIDFNHPFAGKELEYWVELVDLK